MRNPAFTAEVTADHIMTALVRIETLAGVAPHELLRLRDYLQNTLAPECRKDGDQLSLEIVEAFLDKCEAELLEADAEGK